MEAPRPATLRDRERSGADDGRGHRLTRDRRHRWPDRDIRQPMSALVRAPRRGVQAVHAHLSHRKAGGPCVQSGARGRRRACACQRTRRRERDDRCGGDCDGSAHGSSSVGVSTERSSRGIGAPRESPRDLRQTGENPRCGRLAVSSSAEGGESAPSRPRPRSTRIPHARRPDVRRPGVVREPSGLRVDPIDTRCAEPREVRGIHLGKLAETQSEPKASASPIRMSLAVENGGELRRAAVEPADEVAAGSAGSPDGVVVRNDVRTRGERDFHGLCGGVGLRVDAYERVEIAD